MPFPGLPQPLLLCADRWCSVLLSVCLAPSGALQGRTQKMPVLVKGNGGRGRAGIGAAWSAGSPGNRVGILHLWLMPGSPVWFPGSGAALSELAQGLWLLVPTVSSVEKAKAVWLSAPPSPITLAITCGVSVSGLAECQVTGPREVSPPLKLGRGGGLSRSRNQPTGPGSCFLQS